MICAVALLAPVACDRDHPEGARPLNQRPAVRLTGGPLQGDSISVSADFFWTGWDNDGVIDHYQYAVDIPPRFSLDDINSPADRGIAWIDTTANRAHFFLTTPVQDTILKADGTITLPDRYRGDHSFYVRSVDNEGYPSEADYLSFTAFTVTPRTTITLPKVASSSTVLYVGRQITVTWEGLDPDGQLPGQRPAFYEWKLIPNIGEPTLVNAQYAITVSPGPRFPWTRVSGTTTSLRLILNPPEEYVLAIRAVDETGGVENKFHVGRNALVLAASDANPGNPVLVVTEKSLGKWMFPNDPTGLAGGPLWEVEVAAGQCLKFDFSADAQSYGGIIQGYDYGVDVPDPDAEGPGSGFHGWSAYPGTYDPICFPAGDVHTITLKCRDTGEGRTVGTVLVRVIRFLMDRPVLYIDDYGYGGFGTVTDAMMDQRALGMIEAAGYSLDAPKQVYQLDTYDTADREFYPTALKMSSLGRYRLVVWSNFGAGSGGRSALASAASCGSVLRAYVGAGGAVWLYGIQTLGAFVRCTHPTCMSLGCIATVGYDEKNPLNFTAGTFVTDYLHISGGGFRTVKLYPRVDGMLAAVPTARAQAEFFPRVEIDSTVYAAAHGGLENVDAMFTPVYTEGLDTLYTMKTPVRASKFDNKVVAFRYLDPNPGSTQGPVAVFGFPFHLLKQGAVRTVQTDQGPVITGTGVKGMAASMIRWLRQHQRVVR